MIDHQAMAQAFRAFFETTAETTARQTKFVIRRSKLTGSIFVQTLVCGWAETAQGLPQRLG